MILWPVLGGWQSVQGVSLRARSVVSSVQMGSSALNQTRQGNSVLSRYENFQFPRSRHGRFHTQHLPHFLRSRGWDARTGFPESLNAPGLLQRVTVNKNHRNTSQHRAEGDSSLALQASGLWRPHPNSASASSSHLPPRWYLSLGLGPTQPVQGELVLSL